MKDKIHDYSKALHVDNDIYCAYKIYSYNYFVWWVFTVLIMKYIEICGSVIYNYGNIARNVNFRFIQ